MSIGYDEKKRVYYLKKEKSKSHNNDEVIKGIYDTLNEIKRKEKLSFTPVQQEFVKKYQKYSVLKNKKEKTTDAIKGMLGNSKNLFKSIKKFYDDFFVKIRTWRKSVQEDLIQNKDMINSTKKFIKNLKKAKEKFKGEEAINSIKETIKGYKKSIKSIKSHIISQSRVLKNTFSKFKDYVKERVDLGVKKIKKLFSNFGKLYIYNEKFEKYTTKKGKFNLEREGINLSHGTAIQRIEWQFMNLLNYPKTIKKAEMKKFIKYIAPKEDELPEKVENFLEKVEEHKPPVKLVKKVNIIIEKVNACPGNLTVGIAAINSSKHTEDDHLVMISKEGKKATRLKIPDKIQKMQSAWKQLPQLFSSSSVEGLNKQLPDGNIKNYRKSNPSRRKD